MALLAMQCRRVMCLNRLLTHSPSLTQIPDRKATKISTQFPGFSLLYNFQKVKYAGAFNRLKFKFTAGYICGGLVISASQLFGAFLTLPIDSYFIVGGNMMLFMHISGLIINNAIGLIYINEDKSIVKISYVDYWGKRVNIDVSPEDICEYSEGYLRFLEPLYHTIKIKNVNKNLKMYLKDGNILDNELFANLFGKSMS